MQDRKAKAAAPSPGSNGVLAAACGLTALAGCVDVLAVLHGAAILPVYVTGDTTKLAASLIEGAWSRCWPPVAVILAFLASSILTAWLGRIAMPQPRPARAMLLVGGFLLLGVLLGLRAEDGRWDLAVLLAVAAAMGAVNQVLAGDPGVTFITGTLVRASRALSTGQVVRAARDLLRWVAFLAGASAGALLYAATSRFALAVPAGIALLAGAILALRPPSASEVGG